MENRKTPKIKMSTPITTAWRKEWAGDSTHADPIVTDAAEIMSQLERQIEATARRGMTEADRLRRHIAMMAGWIKQVRCQCTEQIGCARCMALACAEVDYENDLKKSLQESSPHARVSLSGGNGPATNQTK
jgi:hypothetical protein